MFLSNLKKIFSPYLVITLAAVLLVMSCEFKPRKTRSLNLDLSEKDDGDSTVVKVTTVVHPEWSKNLSIYEVNIRQFSQAGTFKAFEEHLPRLKELGVGILWLMPINPIGEKNRKGTLGSYYSVKDYYGINPEFGTMEDFRRLVNRIHEMGMYVIIDWVANHTAWDNDLINEYPEWYTTDIQGNFVTPEADWTDVADLNYNHGQLQKYMIDAMKFWVKEADIDGFRCDVAGMVPTEFWEKARPQLEAVKPVFMLAEWEDPALHDKAFDMTYSWEAHRTLNDIAAGKKVLQHLETVLARDSVKYYPDAYRMQFTSNHDENSWNSPAIQRLGDAYEVSTVLTFTVPGMPLIYGGQEAGLNKKLKFFDKDVIPWKRHPMAELYKKLIRLKKENKALWNGTAGGNFIRITTTRDSYVFSFSRNRGAYSVVCFLNMSPSEQSFRLRADIPRGEYKDFFTGEKISFNKTDTFDLPPWGYRVFERRK